MKLFIQCCRLTALGWLLSGTTVFAQTNFATLATDGAWTWYNDSRALFHNGKLYFGFVRAADSKTTLSVFDLQTSQTTNLWSAGFTQLDDHNNPGLLVRQDGRLLAIYARHLADQYFSYRLANSTNPATPAGWNAEQSIPNSGTSMTYANPFQLSAEDGKIYSFCRNLNFNPTVYTSTNGGTNWSAPQAFIQSGTGGVRPYLKYAGNSTNRIDFLYTDGHPRDVANSLYHLYYQGGAFYQTDGTFVKNYASLPLQHDSGERGSVIYQYSEAAQADPNQWIPTGRAWCWETAYQANGAPVCVFTVQRDLVAGSTSGVDDRIYYYYARWTGAAWQKRFIAHAGRPLYVAEDDYAGGICVDPQNPDVIYISSNAQEPFNLADTANIPLRPNSRYELWRGVTSDGGLTFAWTQITTNSAVDNLRPYIPRRNGGEPCVIWFRGTYSTYTAYACSIVGLFTSKTVSNAPPPKISYLDATAGVAGNTVLAAGGTFSPTAQSVTPNGNDGLWRLRALGNGATIYEAGGDNSTAGSAAGGNNEDVARLATTISGLTPARRYAIYAYFWSAAAQFWRIRASLTNAPGDLPLYAHPAEPTAMAGDFTGAPLIAESDRVLKQASLGEAVASGSGTITVYVDDDPAARAGLASGWNYRSWYDGVGYVPVTSTNPTILNYFLDGSTLQLSWPPEHIGWRLESNSVSILDANAWITLADSAQTNQILLAIDRVQSNVFFRLAFP